MHRYKYMHTSSWTSVNIGIVHYKETQFNRNIHVYWNFLYLNPSGFHLKIIVQS